MAETPSIYALLDQTTWIQSLARSLVSDPHAADDLVQDTWLSALESRPDTGRPLRGWLATVLRNHHAKRRRGETNRQAREEQASRHELTASTLDVVEKASTHRDLVESVLSLEEPYRSTILMRFFEQLPHGEIARRMGTTKDTVSSRLTRGLERLRRRLEARHGGDRKAMFSALATLAGSAPGLAVPTLGVNLMHVALGAGALALVVTTATSVLSSPARTSDPLQPTPSLLEPVPTVSQLRAAGVDLLPVEPVPVVESERTPLPLAFVDDQDDWTAEFFENLSLGANVEDVAVSTGAGRVEVAPSFSGLVEIEARVRADRDRVDTNRMTFVFADHVDVFEEDGTLKIEDAHEGNGWSVSLLVRLPGALPLSANSGAGTVEVSYAGSKVHANSGAGKVVVSLPEHEVSSVSANSGAGSVQVDVFRVREELTANSGAGAVNAEVKSWDSTGRLSLNSGAGSVTLTVPAGVVGKFDLESDLGGVHAPSQLGLRHEKRQMGGRMEGMVGSGGGSYRLRSSVGSVTVRFSGRGDARPF